MSLTLKNILINLVYYALTVGLFPALLIMLERRLGWAGHPTPALRLAAAVTGVLGALLQLWCIVLFQRAGGGTPSPAVPTLRLVRAGPYRWIRNPMNVGELSLFLALTAWFASALLLAYTIAAAAAFHLFITHCEEPRLLAREADSYRAYKARVGRWLPSIRRGSG